MLIYWVKCGLGDPIKVEVAETCDVYDLIEAIKNELSVELGNVSLGEIHVVLRPTDTIHDRIPRDKLVTDIYSGQPVGFVNSYNSPIIVLAPAAPLPGHETNVGSSAHFPTPPRVFASKNYVKSLKFLTTAADILIKKHNLEHSYDIPPFGYILEQVPQVVERFKTKYNPNLTAVQPSTSSGSSPKKLKVSQVDSNAIEGEFEQDEWDFLIMLNRSVNKKLYEPFYWSGEVSLTLMLPENFHFGKSRAISIATKLGIVNSPSFFHVENAAHSSRRRAVGNIDASKENDLMMSLKLPTVNSPVGK